MQLAEPFEHLPPGHLSPVIRLAVVRHGLGVPNHHVLAHRLEPRPHELTAPFAADDSWDIKNRQPKPDHGIRDSLGLQTNACPVSGRARAWGTGGGTRGTGRGLERGPRARARAPRAPRDRRDGAWEPREGGGEQGAPAAGRAAAEVHPPRHPTDAGAPHPPPPPPPPPPPLQHRP